MVSAILAIGWWSWLLVSELAISGAGALSANVVGLITTSSSLGASPDPLNPVPIFMLVLGSPWRPAIGLGGSKEDGIATW